MDGEILRSKRTGKGLSQRALADKSGVSQGMISLIEKGTNDPSTDTISRLAAALGCTAAELMGEDAPTRAATDDEIKFALFGGENGITDEQFEEVKKYAAYIKSRGR